MYFWQLCSTSELTNYSSKSIQLLFFSYGHRKLQITSLYSERTAMTGIAIQETIDFGDGDFYRELMSKTIIKTWSELAKLAAKHLRFMEWPCWLPSWLQVLHVFTFWLLVHISPEGTYNLSLAGCLEPGSIYLSSQSGIMFCFMTAQT